MRMRTRPLTINRIAREACLSEFHFHRLFSAAYHESAHAYVRRLRLDRARRLLASGRLGVTEVCAEVGFSRLGSFSMLFRRLSASHPAKLAGFEKRSEAVPPYRSSVTRRRFTALALLVASGGEQAMGTSDVFPGRIGIIMLGVNDLAGAVEFYRGTLAVMFRNQVENIACFDAGAVTLCLNGGLAQAAGGAEYVFNVDHVRAAYDWLRARGVQFIREPHNVTGTSWAANFRDPDGHLLSVFGPE